VQALCPAREKIRFKSRHSILFNAIAYESYIDYTVIRQTRWDPSTTSFLFLYASSKTGSNVRSLSKEEESLIIINRVC
jgi:hypothetical protein